MKITIKRPCHIYVLPCEVEVSTAEAHRLMMLGVAEPLRVVEVPETPKKVARKKKAKE